jgi:hypothetical protein
VAFEGNPTMLIFLGKNILGQTDQPVNNDNNMILPFTDDIDEEVIEEEVTDIEQE